MDIARIYKYAFLDGEDPRIYLNQYHEPEIRHGTLISQLEHSRSDFAGLGTRKAKIRLNKLAKTDPKAKAIRLALEIEDKNISAKKSYGEFKQKIYRQKSRLINELIELCKIHKWKYGIRKSDVPPTTHVIYFELPECEQISWHYTPEKNDKLPVYRKKWDGKTNSTLGKLEQPARKLLNC